VFIPGLGRKTVNKVVSEGAPACQTVYALDGTKAFSGEWDPRLILNVLSASDSAFWSGKSVLDLGANTGGLSVEIARLGARVTLAEPDPYKNTLQRSLDTVRGIVADEKLDLDIQQLDLIQTRQLPAHDVILCLGLLYHFKYPQYIIDTLSWMKPAFLFLSCQTHPSDDIAMYNRRHPGILARNHFERVTYPLSGWHPTRSALKLMLEAGGFGEIVDLTNKRYDFPQKMPGLTNTTYYRAKCLAPKNPDVEKAIFYPR